MIGFGRSRDDMTGGGEGGTCRCAGLGSKKESL